jgi:hypothetical protein
LEAFEVGSPNAGRHMAIQTATANKNRLYRERIERMSREHQQRPCPNELREFR